MAQDEALDDVRVVERIERGGLLDGDLVPREIELVCHDLPESGLRALAHLRVRREQGDGPIGVHDEPQRQEHGITVRVGGLLAGEAVVHGHAGERGAHAEQQRARGHAAADQEVTSVERHQDAPCAARMAVRIRS